jgi:hypothetical protein
MIKEVKEKYVASIEKLELEREQTMLDPKFQEWMRNLGVSQSYEDISLRLNARDMMDYWGNNWTIIQSRN